MGNFIKTLSSITFLLGMYVSPVSALLKCGCNDIVELPEILLGPNDRIKIKPIQSDKGPKLRYLFSILDNLTRPDMPPNIIKFMLDLTSNFKDAPKLVGSNNQEMPNNERQPELNLYNLGLTRAEDGSYRLVFRNEIALKATELENRIDRFNAVYAELRQTNLKPIEFMKSTFAGNERTFTVAKLKIESGEINDKFIINGLLWPQIPIFAYRTKEGYERLETKLRLYEKNLRELFNINVSSYIQRLLDRFLLSAIKFNFVNKDDYNFSVFYADNGLLGIRDSLSLRIKCFNKKSLKEDKLFVTFDEKNELRNPPSLGLAMNFKIEKVGDLEFKLTLTDGYTYDI